VTSPINIGIPMRLRAVSPGRRWVLERDIAIVSDADLQVDSTPTMEKNRADALYITMPLPRKGQRGMNWHVAYLVRPPDDLSAQHRPATAVVD
jgi:hypothetical protein